MTYNLHPILVHFPIAFLFLYSVIKIIPFRKLFTKILWREIERALLLFGTLGAFAALLTGETAEHLIRPNRQLVGAHSTFATIATIIYCALLVGEIASVINAKNFNFKNNFRWFFSLLKFLESILCNALFSALLAPLGLIAITVTGILGGIMVYGLTADPLAGIVIKLLGITLN